MAMQADGEIFMKPTEGKSTIHIAFSLDKY
jgi:hypothetical protein